MAQNTENRADLVFSYQGIPPAGQLIPLGLQHVVAAVVGVITPAMIVSGTCGLSAEEKTLLIQVSLVVTALATLLQLFPIFGRIGARLPVIMGISFAYVPTLQAIGADFGLPAILGAELVGGLVAILFGIFVRPIRKLFPPLVTGTVIFTIGLSLYPTAVRYMAGGSADSEWFALPEFMPFEIAFEPAAIASLAIVYVVNSVQTIGDLSSTTMGGMDRLPTDKELSGGIIGQGIMSVLGAFFGGLPVASYSQNVGIVTVNKVINRAVFALAALIMLVAGFIPKFASVLSTIPQCVVGGATISVFATITMTGIRMITDGGFTARKSTVVGLSVALGVGITQVPGCLGGNGFPDWVHTVFGSSSVVVATLMAILLNLILPKEKAPAGTAAK